MATEVFQFTGVAGTTHYLAVFNSAGEVFDFADNTFKALSGATTPYVAATERADMGGSKSGYTASVNLANLNGTTIPMKFFCDWYTDIFLTNCESNTVEFCVASSDLIVTGLNVASVTGDVAGGVGSVMAGVTLAASQPNYAPAKAGDAMALESGVVNASTIADGAISDAKFTMPGVSSGPASGVLGRIDQLWRYFFKKGELGGGFIRTYADDGTTVLTTQVVVDDGQNQTRGAAV